VETERIYGRLDLRNVLMWILGPASILMALLIVDMPGPYLTFWRVLAWGGFALSVTQLFLIVFNIYYLQLTPTGWREHGAPYAKYFRWDECGEFYDYGFGVTAFKLANGKVRSLSHLIGHDPKKHIPRLNAYRAQALASMKSE
jgi:hypothetical protein